MTAQYNPRSAKHMRPQCSIQLTPALYAQAKAVTINGVSSAVTRDDAHRTLTFSLAPGAVPAAPPFSIDVM